MTSPIGEIDSRPLRVSRGDQVALAAAFDEHRPRLRQTVLFRMNARLRGRVDADDVLQDAFLAAVERWSHFKGATEQSLFIWLRMIVLQTIADVHRRHLGAQKRDAGREIAPHHAPAALSTSMSLTAGLIGSLTSPSEAFRRAERAEALRAALERMDAVDREVLALRHFEDLTNQEVAEALGIGENAASMRYVRALRRLKAILGEFPSQERAGPPGAAPD